MSTLRPECGTAKDDSRNIGSRISLLWEIYGATNRCRSLAYGKLDDDKGRHCAMGAFWEKNPSFTVPSKWIDEVAAVNDSIPPTESDHARWKHVRRWLRFQLGIDS